MTSMTATSYDTGAAATRVAATAATRQIASVSSQDTAGSASAIQGDPFGPAVVVEISDEAKEANTIEAYDLEADIKHSQSQYLIWAKEHGDSEEQQNFRLLRIEKNSREGYANMINSRAEYKRSQKILSEQQGNMEEALDQADGAPQSLIDAVRTVNNFRYDAGGAGSSVVYDDPKVREQIRQVHGEDVLQRLTANVKAYDAAATLRAQISVGSLGRYGLEGSAFTMDGGHFKMTSFTLGKIAGGYSMSFDPESSAFTVMRQGEDITAAIFKGTAFRQDSSRSA